MIGAIAGDIVGSVYEFHNVKTKDFPLFTDQCFFTDDSVLTIALADAILTGTPYVQNLKTFYRWYPDRGYGGSFHHWAQSKHSQPYNSWGNGAAMRISPVGYAFDDLDTVLAESLSGLIERVTFFNEENGFAVLKVKAKGHRDQVTIVGSLPSVSAGEWVTAQGRWIQDREFGLQFKAEMLTSTAPTTKEGIEKYLGSGMVKGIGPIYAKKLVDNFGEQIFETIEQESARLEELDGIGPKRRQRIKGAWAEQKVIREIMVFLHSNGVSTSRAVRIYKTYGEDAFEKVRSDPYQDVKTKILYPANPGSIYHMTKTQDALFFQFYNKNDKVRVTDLHQGVVWGTFVITPFSGFNSRSLEKDKRYCENCMKVV